MKIERRHSYGVIPFYKNERGEYEVLLILQSRLGPKVWGFPKGTPEGEETPIETARREVCEEIGCTDLHIDEGTSSTESYTFIELDGSEISKEVTYFLAFLENKEITIQDSEIDDYTWSSIAEAKERITYPETLEAFQKIVESL